MVETHLLAVQLASAISMRQQRCEMELVFSKSPEIWEPWSKMMAMGAGIGPADDMSQKGAFAISDDHGKDPSLDEEREPKAALLGSVRVMR